MYCRFSGGYYVNIDGEIDTQTDPTTTPPSADYPLWDNGDAGYLIDCEFPLRSYSGAGGGGNIGSTKQNIASSYHDKTKKNGQITIESIAALEYTNYFEYVPYRARMSYFWKNNWLAWNIRKGEGLGGGFTTNAEIFFSFQSPGLGRSACRLQSDKMGRHPRPNAAPEAIKATRISSWDLPEPGTCARRARSRIGAGVQAIFCNGDGGCSVLDAGGPRLTPSRTSSTPPDPLLREEVLPGCWNRPGVAVELVPAS